VQLAQKTTLGSSKRLRRKLVFSLEHCLSFFVKNYCVRWLQSYNKVSY
jgi:hypothetical protein